MKLHPRTQPVDKAAADIRAQLLDLQVDHDLTDVEMLRILLAAAERVSKRLLRDERHPGNPDRKGDEDCDALCRHDEPEPPGGCSDCGRAARDLQPWYGDVGNGVEIVAWLGPTCHRRRLDAAQKAAYGGHVCQVLTVPLGGTSA